MNASQPQSRRDLLIRADATIRVGAGHVMRCLSLAEAWIKLGIGRVSLCGAVEIDFVQRRMRGLGIDLVDSLKADESTVLLVDTYDLETRSRLGHFPTALRILVDDLGFDEPSDYDIIWNPNAYGSAALYPSFSRMVIAGSDAVPLAEIPHQWKPTSSDVCVVTLGLATVEPRIQQAFQALSESRPGVRFEGTGDWIPAGWDRVAPESLWIRAAVCAFLITAAGSSVWQAASIGPPLVVVKTAENQKLIAEFASRHEVPVVDALQPIDSHQLSRELLTASEHPRPMPKLSNGAGRVALAIQQATRRDA